MVLSYRLGLTAHALTCKLGLVGREETRMRITDFNTVAEDVWTIRVNGRKVGEIRRKLGRRVHYVSQSSKILPEIFVPAISRRVHSATRAGIHFFCDTLNRRASL